MSIINCPDCAKEISDRAETCIHCGCPLDLTGEQRSQPKTLNEELRRGTLVSCSPEGRGQIKDIDTNQIISFFPSEVSENKLLHGYSGKTILYEKIAGRLKIHAPPDAPANPFFAQNSKSPPHHSTAEKIDAPANGGGKKITKNYLWYLMVLIIIAGYWISKGTPSPALFFAGSTAKSECVRLAEENKGSMFLIGSGDIRANDTWIRDGKRVVQLIQETPDGMHQIMCLYSNGMVFIPSALEQGRWR